MKKIKGEYLKPTIKVLESKLNSGNLFKAKNTYVSFSLLCFICIFYKGENIRN